MSNEDETYNGWANRETWAVALHINNDQGWQESVREVLRTADPALCPDCGAEQDDTDHEGFRDCVECGAAWLPSYVAGEIVRENVEGWFEEMRHICDREDSIASLWSVRDDIGSLWRVSWTELGASFLEDLEDDDA